MVVKPQNPLESLRGQVMFVSMVAHATTSPLPLLSPEDKRLLRIYFRVGQSIQALADELISLDAINRSSTDSPQPIPHSPLPDEFDLATWATSETIAPHINYRKQELADARREEALKELTSLVKHSDDALERRRAATTLLRMLSTQLLRTKRDPSPPPPLGTPPLRGSFPSSPAAGTGGGRGARAAGGEGSVPTPPTNAPFTSDTQPNTTASDHNSCSAPSPSAQSAASLHSPLPTPHSHPPPLPDLFSTGDLPHTQLPPPLPLAHPRRTHPTHPRSHPKPHRRLSAHPLQPPRPHHQPHPGTLPPIQDLQLQLPHRGLELPQLNPRPDHPNPRRPGNLHPHQTQKPKPPPPHHQTPLPAHRPPRRLLAPRRPLLLPPTPQHQLAVPPVWHAYVLVGMSAPPVGPLAAPHSRTNETTCIRPKACTSVAGG